MTTQSTPTKAVLYLRMSSEKTDPQDWQDRPTEDCAAVLARLGWTAGPEGSHLVVETASGTKTETWAVRDPDGFEWTMTRTKRPGWNRVLRMLADGTADALVAYNLDRVTRHDKDLDRLLSLVEDGRLSGAHVAVATGFIDLRDERGILYAKQDVDRAHMEAREIARRVTRRRVQQAQQGIYGGGPRPYGYDKDGVTVRPDEQAVVQGIARRILTHDSLYSIARWLTADGIPTVTGRPWSVQTIRSLMLRPRNAGIAVYKGEETGPASWPALLDEDQWRGVCAVLTDPDRKTSPGNKPRHLGSGLYLCGKCGSPMRSSTKDYADGRATVYRCTKSAHVIRKAEPVDEAVQAILLNVLTDADALAARRVSNGIDTVAVTTDLAGTRARLDRLDDDRGDGLIDGIRYRRQVDRLTQRITELETTLARVAVDRHDPVTDLAAAEQPRWTWLTLPLEKQREILATLVTVTVKPGRRGLHSFDPQAELTFTWKGDDEQPEADVVTA